MAEERKLDLAWTHLANSQNPVPGINFEVFDDAKETKTPYMLVFRVCPIPRCPCLSVCVGCAQCSPDLAAPAGPLPLFWVDVQKRILKETPELKADPRTFSLAQWITTRLSGRAWEELHQWFWPGKIKAIETADVSRMDISQLPKAGDGRLIPFSEVFHLGLSLNFVFEQADWAADEAYCVQPGCACQEMILYFLKLRDAGGQRAGVLREVPAIH